jgi:acetyltransferase-like isoleucine patch superfamily enzyme
MNFKKHINYFRSDFKGELSFLYFTGKDILIKSIFACVTRFELAIKGISYGRSIIFHGTIHTKRFQNSSIIIGDNCTFLSRPFSNQIGVDRPCMISTQTEKAKIEIGNLCGFSGTVIGAFEHIKFGNNVRCGANTLITDSDWHTDDYRSGKSSPVFIEDNVWLGVNVTVLKGVTIGQNTIIGAGSVVTKDIPANVVAAGNPCKVIKQIKIGCDE